MKYLLFVFLPIVGCGIQNSSILTQPYRADTVSFSDIREGALVFRGLKRDGIEGWDALAVTERRVDRLVDRELIDDRPVVPGMDAIVGFGVDSLNSLYFGELQKQFTQRFQRISISKPSNPPIPDGYEVRLTRLRISPKYSVNEGLLVHHFWPAYGEELEKAVVVAEVELLDLRDNSIKFRVLTGAEIIAASYGNPWMHAITLTVMRLAEFIASDGREYARSK